MRLPLGVRYLVAGFWLAAAAACTETLAPAQQESLLKEADTALSHGRLAEAESGFERVASAAPQNARAHFGLGLARSRLRRGTEALESFQKAQELEPGNPDYAYLRARSLVSLGQWYEAIEAFRTLIQDHPDQLQATAELLSLMIQAGRLEEARGIVLEALNRVPNHFTLQLLAGRILGESGDHAASAEHYARARLLRPYSPQPVYGLIQAYRNTDRVPESLELIRLFEALQARGKDLEAVRAEATRNPSDPQPARRYIDRLFDDGRLEEGAEQTEIFLSQFPRAAEGRSLAVRAALASLRSGNMEASRRFLHSAQSLGEPSGDELISMAEARAALEEHPQAIELYERYLAESPDDPRAHLGIGRVFLRSGDLDRAEPALRVAVALTKGSAPARASLGLLLIKREDAAAARAELRAALEREPGQIDALFGLGFLAHQKRDNKQAELYLRKALEQQPDYLNAQVVLALVLSEQGMCDEAIPLFTRMLRTDYKNMTLHAGLVRCLEQTGRTAEAQQAREIAEQLLGQAP